MKTLMLVAAILMGLGATGDAREIFLLCHAEDDQYGGGFDIRVDLDTSALTQYDHVGRSSPSRAIITTDSIEYHLGMFEMRVDRNSGGLGRLELHRTDGQGLLPDNGRCAAPGKGSLLRSEAPLLTLRAAACGRTDRLLVKSIAEICVEIVGYRLCFIGGHRRALRHHIGDDDGPSLPVPFHSDHALEVMAECATLRDQILARSVGQGDRFGRRQIHPGTEIVRQISNHGLDLGLGQLRSAQHHIVDIAPPAWGAVADFGDSAEVMALRAGHRNEIVAATGRQRVGALLRAARRYCGAQCEGKRKRIGKNKSAHRYTFRVRCLASEYGGYHCDTAPRPSRLMWMSSR